jgi:hypothetical protein
MPGRALPLSSPPSFPPILTDATALQEQAFLRVSGLDEVEGKTKTIEPDPFILKGRARDLDEA